MKTLPLAALSIGLCFGQNNDCTTLESCQQALKTNRQSSLTHFRLGEIYLQQADYIQSANEFRSSTTGDLNPRWVEVWAHIQLGKIFQSGTTSQPERAFNEFRQALRTGDNTFGAQDELVRLLKEMGVEVQPRILDSQAHAEPIEKTPVDYTGEASIAELEGTVLLEGTVGEDGLARDLTVRRALGLGLDERAIDAAGQWLFSPKNGQSPSTHVVIAVDFFLSSKLSRWHLVRVDFNLPPGVARPIFLSAPYPRGAGVLGSSAIEEGRLLGGIGRQASARVSFRY